MARPPESLFELVERLFLIAAASTLLIVVIKFLMRFIPGGLVVALLVAGLFVLMVIDLRRVQRVRLTDAGIDPQDGSPLMLWRDVVSVDRAVYRGYSSVGLFACDNHGRIIRLATALTWSTEELLEGIRDQVGPSVTMNGRPFGGRKVVPPPRTG